MFEKFNVSGFYDSEQAVLSLYAVGRISGCTVDIGHGKIGNIQLYVDLNCSLVDSTLLVADNLLAIVCLFSNGDVRHNDE
jgi:hypothetical protein